MMSAPQTTKFETFPPAKRLQTQLLIGFLLLVTLSGTAQSSLSFDHLGPEDGLTDLRIESIHQDRKGFMWFGTERGLNRYDGRQMKTFAFDPGQPDRPYPSIVYNILEDKEGNLWLGGLGEFFCYNSEEDEFTYIDDMRNFPQLLILDLYLDKRDEVWLAAHKNGLMHFDRERGKLVPFAQKFGKDLKPEYVTAILEDSFGNLWFAYPNGLYQFTRKDSTLLYHPFRKDYDWPVDDKMVHTLFEDGNKDLWVGTRWGLFRFNRELKKFSPFPLHSDIPDSSLAISAICEAADGKLWINGSNGLFILDAQLNRISHYPADPDVPGALKSNNIRTIYRDWQGDMWIGTINAGIFHWSRNRKPFLSHAGRISDIIERNNGQIWVVNEWGTAMFDPDREQLFQNPNLKNGYRGTEDQQGRLWFGSWESGLIRLDSSTGSVTAYRPDPMQTGSLPGNAATEVLADRQGTVWVAVWTKGLFRYEPDRDVFSAHPLIHPITGDTAHPTTYRMYEDRNENLWIATGSVLVKLNRNRVTETFFPIPGNSLTQDNQGKIWVASFMGLCRIDPGKEDFRVWHKKDGLPHSSVYGVVEDDHGRLWLSTHKGLSRYNPKTNSFRNYDISDGLPGDIFTRGACLKSRSGELYFGLPSGLLRFHPDSIRDNPYIPPVVITGFQIRNRPVPIHGSPEDTLDYPSPLLEQIPYAEEIRLNWRQNEIGFEFAALNYFHPEKNQYKYRLENYDADWITTDAKRPYATYTNLDPGAYTFRVIGSNNDGVWNEEGATLRIVIHPPWWWNGWSKSLYVGLFLLGLWAVRRYEIRRQRLRHALELEQVKAAQLAEVDALKTRFFTNISHEFRTPLTLILGPIQELITLNRQSNLRQGLELIRRNSRRLLHLINQLLDLSRLEAKGMKLQAAPADLLPFLRQLFAAFTSTAEARRIRYTLQTDRERLPLCFDPEKLEKILLNLLANAFKFTPEGGEIQLQVQTADNQVSISVTDTGPGIPADQLPRIFDRFYQAPSPPGPPEGGEAGPGSTRWEGTGSGVGLALAKELAELHHGSITAESEPGAGARFTLTLPLGKDHLRPEEIAPIPAAPSPVDITLIGALPAPEKAVEPAQPLDGELPLLLIVEDNADMRAYIRQGLDARFRIAEAADGAQGLAFATEQVPDIVVSDVMMPGPDGFELCYRLKTDERTSHIPVILLTARADDDSRIAGLQRGADAYLAKPFLKEELLVHLQKLIELRRRLQERYRSPNPPAPSADPGLQVEDEFIRKFRRLLEDHLDDPEYGVPQICRALGMSRAQLYRKIKALTDESVGDYFRSLRLRKARELLRHSNLNVSEVAYEVGFRDPAYFSRAFKEEFGVPPSEMR